MKLNERLSTLPRDVVAGIVVFLVALPLCLGIANASGVEPFAGLVSGIVGGIVVALLSGSSLSVSGPAAGLVVIVVEGIAQLGSFSAFLLAVLLSGVLQFGFGMLRAGRFAAYVPSPVIKGMLAAIGLLLIVKQIPFAFGIGGSGAQSFANWPSLPVAWAATAIALVSLALLAAWDTPALRRFALVRSVPAPLAVVVLGIGATLVLGLVAPSVAPGAAHRVTLPELGSFAAFAASLKHAELGPNFAQLVNPDVWRVAITLAVVASLETLLSLEAVEQIDPKRRPTQPDRELKAQGVGNLVAGAFGGLPITSVIVRSSVNVNAGAQSRMSAIVHGMLLLASVFALTGLINLIPLASLAAILIHTGFKLAKPALFRSVMKQGPAAFVPFAATIAGVLAVDLLFGIALGLACSVLAVAAANLKSPVTLAQHDDHFLLSFRKDVSFLGKVQVKHHLRHIPDRAAVIIDATRADYIDHDVLELLDAFVADAPRRGIAVEFRRRSPAPRPAARRWLFRAPAAE
ncbi:MULTISPECIES: SulP family inorganic anion transporter [Burkholderia]|uniref:MFS superfamily sulfate permease-like transporter n=1 Tax=Burkholderia pyrrocinia TaxID=60550 RepID=A0A318IBV1_BURPY|nr:MULTISPECIES: SulP family inorganic anion transporter [Burkholderia]PXX29508.1 MFS superfamily sulfate permease-like transporter [Burkholderia pyrrocinia]SFW71012.1 Sulfate permease, MFS superfamily [Burkholderia sp. NFACC33-1]SFY33974.1 Sulfate permease, MFS superfamily [Burkholderia sp. NFPP32]